MIISTKSCLSLLVLATVLFNCSPRSKDNAYPEIAAPVAEKHPYEITAKHGHKRIDNYYWLKNRDDSSVIRYLKAENQYMDTMSAHTRLLQERLFAEMKARIKEKDESSPVKDGPYFYYTRYEEGYDYPVYCRKLGSLDAPEEVIANGNEWGKNQKYFSLFIRHSPARTI